MEPLMQPEHPHAGAHGTAAARANAAEIARMVRQRMGEHATVSPQILEQFRSIGVADVIVFLRDEPLASRDSVALSEPWPHVERLRRHFVVDPRSQNSALARHAALDSAPGGAGAAVEHDPPPMDVLSNLGLVLGTVTEDGFAGLLADDQVSTVTGVPQLGLVRPVSAGTSADRRGWGLDELKVPALWQQGLTGRGVRVAHLDSGVDAKHPALAPALHQYIETDLVGNIVEPAVPPRDSRSDGHGTHTAAIIAGRAVGTRQVGVAPGAELCSAMVIETGNISRRVLRALNWSVPLSVRVVNLSLGLRGWREDFLPLVAVLRARRILVVAAVGNEGPGTSRSPGNYPTVLSVGAIDRDRVVAPFSSSQQFQRADPLVPDLLAPGVDILSARAGGGYRTMSGTSMAAPHVAGLAALLCEARPQASVEEIERAIYASCNLPATVPPDRGSRGIPDATAAFTFLTGVTIGATPRPATTAGGLPPAPGRHDVAPQGRKRTRPAAGRATRRARIGKRNRKKRKG
jgi:subtilisin family serine protease